MSRPTFPLLIPSSFAFTHTYLLLLQTQFAPTSRGLQRYFDKTAKQATLPTHQLWSRLIHPLPVFLFGRPQTAQPICPTIFPVPWFSSNQPIRFQEIILTRLRKSYPRLTPVHLFFTILRPFYSHFSNNLPLAVDHLFSWPQLTTLRTSLNIPQNRDPALAYNSIAISYIFSFLQSSGFLSLM